MAINGKRELFAHEYLKDLHGTNAAIRAGYSKDSARTQASQLLADPDVQDLIARLSAERNQELKINARDVLLELHRMLTADVSQAFDVDGSLLPIHDIPLDLRRTISSFEVEEVWSGRGADREQTGILRKVKFWSKEKGAELLGRHLALFNDKLDLNVSGDLAERIVKGRQRTDG